MKNQTFYTNLPPKEKEALQKTIDALTKTAYTDDFQFNAGEYDASIGFFVKRGFSRTSAEGIAYIILRQAKIDSISPQEILDKITYATPTNYRN